jgi:uncharacterized phage protein (TIGR01671 family)
MREIKFRAWDKYSKKYLYDHDVYITLGGVFREHGYEGMEDCSEGQFIIQQYTGLKDKSGKEIYEGDILKEHFGCYKPEMSTEWIDLSNDDIFEAKIPDIFFRMGGQFNETLDEEMDTYKSGGFFEVIGNTHENRELIT